MDNDRRTSDSASAAAVVPVILSALNGTARDRRKTEDGDLKTTQERDPTTTVTTGNDSKEPIKQSDRNKVLKMQSLAKMDATIGAAPKKNGTAAGGGGGNSRAGNGSGNPPKKKGWKVFWKRTMADMTNKNLLPIKVLFFFKAATLFVLYPFLTLHIKSLGLDSAEAGINSAFIPVVAILGPPVAGIIADKIGNFKVLLAAMTLVTAGLSLLLLLVPIARETVTLPLDLTFALSCGDGAMKLEMVEHNLCTLDLSKSPWTQLHPSIAQCGTLCPVLKKGKNFGSKFEKFSALPVTLNKTYLMPGKKLTFTPLVTKRPSLICGKGSNVSCFFAYAELEDPSVSTTVKTQFSHLQLLGKGLKDKTNVTELNLLIQGSFDFGESEFDITPGCMESSFLQTENGTACVDRCLINYDRKLFCSNKEETMVYDVPLTFWMYTLFRIILGLGSATTWIMFEGAVLAILKECGGDYGLQRVSALVAAVVVCPLSGALIYCFQDFRPAFYLYAVLQSLSAFLTLKIDLTFKTPAEKVLGHLKEVLSQIEILIFFLAMFLSGSAWGYLESFLFWFLKNMGGSEILMGLTVSVGGLTGLPLLIVSRVVIKKIGHVNVLCIGLFFYFIRLFGYSFIDNPWMCLPFEAMEAITASLAITAAATYAAALSTEQTIASIQGFMGALYFGIGRGAGSLAGGFFIKWYGERATFQIFGIVSLISSIIYFVANILYLRKHTRVKQGLDLNNLRGDKFDDHFTEGPSSTKASELPLEATNPDVEIGHRYIEPPITQDLGISDISALPSLNGGYVGPCEDEEEDYTDIPLNEEDQSESTSKSVIQRRPLSLPEKSYLDAEVSKQRSAES